MKNKKVAINCPVCKKFLTESDKDNRTHKLQCRNCWKWIFFNPETKEFEVRDVPARHCSSGMRFY